MDDVLLAEVDVLLAETDVLPTVLFADEIDALLAEVVVAEAEDVVKGADEVLEELKPLADAVVVALAVTGATVLVDEVTFTDGAGRWPLIGTDPLEGTGKGADPFVGAPPDHIPITRKVSNRIQSQVSNQAPLTLPRSNRPVLGLDASDSGHVGTLWSIEVERDTSSLRITAGFTVK